MPKKQTLEPVHKHIMGVALVALLAIIFGVLIYPKLAILAELPTKPQNLSVDVGEEYVVASWTAPALNGDSPIVGYNVSYYRSDKPGTAVNDSVSDSTFNYSILLADLTPELEYTFVVNAVNSGGVGDPNTATFTPPAVVASVPSAPQNCLLTPGDAQVTISCDLPADLAGADMSSYVIYYGTKDYTPIEVSTTKALTYAVASLQNSTTYNFYVTAKNKNDIEGDATSIFTATPVSSGGGGGGDPLEISAEPTVTTTSNSATIHWTTNKEASSKVYYGPTQDIKGVSPEANTTPRVQNHETQITGLLSCVTYWFKSESFDADGNSVQSLGGEFKTSGCKGDSTIVASDIKTVTAVTGATASAKIDGKGITAVAPAGIKDGLDIAIEALKLEQDKVATEINSPSGKEWVGDNAYSLKALQDEVTEVDGGFDQSVSVSIDYTDEDLNGFDRTTLKIYHYEDGSGWMPLTNCVNVYEPKVAGGTVTCDTTSFSVFGLFADAETGGGGGASPSSTSNGYNTANNANPVPPTSPLVYEFKKDLAYTMTDADVLALQKFLNSVGFNVSPSGLGSSGSETSYFGPRTKNALIKFQEAYKAEILTPLGLAHGTGFFGPKTRAFVNALLNK